MMVGAISVAEQGVDREVYTSAQTPHIGWWSVYLQWGFFLVKKYAKNQEQIDP